MTDRPPFRVVAAAVAAVAMPALMLAVSAGLVPAPTPTAPVWWALPVVAVGYWVVWMAWADGRPVPGR
ncbi:hypothetical protein RYH80_11505 [Halobaculum sp. MBLA0147]|uniref:hypothetical protein n=1 Tax=Halobaculum sp. MBLA0147 TaxID=3079934 RepID=UPI0035245266